MTLQKLLLVLVVPLGFLPVTLSLGIPVSHSTDAGKKHVATQRAPAPTPAPTPAPVLQNQIFRRDQRTCGALQGGYPDSDGPPVCLEGSACTFTSNSGYQGCCQEGSCTFYTTCYAYSDRGSCRGSCTSSGLVWYVGRSFLCTTIRLTYVLVQSKLSTRMHSIFLPKRAGLPVKLVDRLRLWCTTSHLTTHLGLGCQWS
jgi:hypothetical protein